MTQGTTERPMLAAALGYAARGWDVFPAPPGEKKSCKSAAYSNGAKWGRTRDPEQIRRDFDRWKDANVGIPTGAEAGFWVVEADTPKGHDVDGIASLRVLEEKHGPLPPTLMAESPSGSLHHYFKWPEGIEIRNSASGIGPGIDVRGEGGMVIAPPSVRGDGSYRWLNDNPIADAPQWLIDAAVAASKSSGKGADGVAEEPQAPIERIRAAFAVIPNEKRGWDDWNRFGLALFHATAGSDDGLAIFHAWSRKSKKYDAQATDERWAHHKTYPPTEIGAGSIFHWADEASPGWEMLIGMPLEKAMKVAALVSLSKYEYENERKAVAEEMGMRTSVLDDMVDRLRPRGADADDDGKQGHAISFPEPEPWPELVNGAAMLNAMAAAIRRHVVMSFASSHVAALWVLHSWLIDCFVISPRLGIRSATKGCGKTLFLDVLGRLVRRPLRALSITPAATFRVVEGWQPTLLIDEADTFLNDNEGLRGILDGNRKGDTALRTVGDDHEVRAFATYAAVAIALIGTLPDTLHDRSVVIELKRRLSKEKIAPFRFDRAGHLDVLARMAVRWAQDNAEHVAATDPEIPEGVINREADNWRPLAAIAAVAKGRWPARLAKAATAAHAGVVEGDAASALEMLLTDIRDAFATDKATKVRDMFGAEQIEITSADLVKTLVALDGRPWPEMGRDRKPMTQNRLASMLRPLKIKSRDVGPEDARVKGYRLDQFSEAFDRYLEDLEEEEEEEEGSQPRIRAGADKTGISNDSNPRSPKNGCADATSQKPPSNGHLRGCADAEGGTDGKTHVRPAKSKSDDLPYRGSVVEVPDLGPDPLDEHGEPAAVPCCAYCGRPGGAPWDFGGKTIHLHPKCEEPYVDGKMREQGVAS